MTHVLWGGWREACRVPRLPALVLPERLGSGPLLCGAGRVLSRDKGSQY